MRNKAMEQKLRTGEAIDLSDKPRNEEGDYVLTDFVRDADYCDAKEEKWIWSIGRDTTTSQILASTTTKFYQHPQFECLWLR